MAASFLRTKAGWVKADFRKYTHRHTSSQTETLSWELFDALAVFYVFVEYSQVKRNISSGFLVIHSQHTDILLSHLSGWR